MLNRFFSLSPLLLSIGFAAVRVITGILMIYHGFQVFNADRMRDYSQWLGELKFPLPEVAGYLGKSIELMTGILFVLGLFTRLAAFFLAVAMLVICFGVGHGRIFSDDQHPFLLALLALLFFFTGAGKWSLDHFLFGYRTPFS